MSLKVGIEWEENSDLKFSSKRVFNSMGEEWGKKMKVYLWEKDKMSQRQHQWMNGEVTIYYSCLVQCNLQKNVRDTKFVKYLLKNNSGPKVAGSNKYMSSP